MTGRSVPLWEGATADTAAPPRVRVRVFERAEGRCHRCRRKIMPGDRWTLEHLIALVNGGLNREDNLGVTCSWCLPEKNAEDVAEKATVARKRAKHIGARPRLKRPLMGSKASGWKQKIGGGWERRDA